MRIVVVKSVFKKLKTFPYNIQEKADTLIGLLSIDWRDVRLHTKKLQGDDPYYSFRIGISYRGIFMFETSDTIRILDIDHRKDIYR